MSDATRSKLIPVIIGVLAVGMVALIVIALYVLATA